MTFPHSFPIHVTKPRRFFPAYFLLSLHSLVTYLSERNIFLRVEINFYPVRFARVVNERSKISRVRARIRISFSYSGKDPIPRVPFRVVIYIGRFHRVRVRCDRVRACASISGVAGEGWGAAHAGELKCRRTRYLKHSHAQSGLHLHRHYYLNSYTFSSPTTCPFRGKRERERKHS